MKRRFFLVVALVLLVLVSGFAEGTTWTNPYDLLTQSVIVPHSMLSSVSSGIYYDEIDTIILSPAELSNYSGFSIFTGYGNYEYDYLLGSSSYDPDDMVNPFGDTEIEPGDNMDANYKFGVTGDLFDFHSGALTSIEFKQSGNMNIGSADAEYEKETTDTEDLDGDATADYTWTGSEQYTDYKKQSTFYLGVGTDIDILGVSLYGVLDNDVRTLGGKYAYTYTSNEANEDTYTDPADVVTAKTVLYGHGEDGKNSWEPDSIGTDWLLGARGHFPMEISGFSMPVKADINFGSMNTSVSSYDPQKSVTLTATNITGITDTTATNTITTITGQAMNTNWNPQTVSGVLDSSAAAASYNQAAFRTDANNVAGASYALDADNYSNVNFMAGFDGLIDPEIVVSDVFSLNTRAQIGYMIDFSSEKDAGKKSAVYSEAVDGLTEKSTFNYSATILAPETTVWNTIDLELGGLFDLHNRENTVSVATGLFYHPTFNFGSVSAKDKVETISVSWTDLSLVNEVTGIGDTIGPNNFEGNRTDTTTTTYADNKKSSNTIITNKFYIPASTRIKMAEDKFELIGGYLLEAGTARQTVKTYSNVATTVTSLETSDGTAITLADAPVTTSKFETTTVSLSELNWAGQMSFMLRWNAMEGLTVDFYGQSIMSALDFDIFGDDGNTTGPDTIDGFNPASFIDKLGISVTISVK